MIKVRDFNLRDFHTLRLQHCKCFRRCLWLFWSFKRNPIYCKQAITSFANWIAQIWCQSLSLKILVPISKYFQELSLLLRFYMRPSTKKVSEHRQLGLMNPITMSSSKLQFVRWTIHFDTVPSINIADMIQIFKIII